MPDKNGKKDTFMGILAEEHVREAERLRKAWVDHVFVSLEKLGKNIDGLSSELHTAKDELYKEIVIVRETIRKELLENRKDSTRELEKLEKRIEKVLDELSTRIKGISIHSLKEELNKEIAKVKTELTKEVTIIKDEKIAPLQTNVTELTTKVKMAAFMFSILGIAVAEAFFKWILPIIVKILAGAAPL
jgi:hypothetical protein